MDGKLPEISVLDSKCLMAEKFGILFTRVGILAPKNGYAVRALNLGLNPEVESALGDNVPPEWQWANVEMDIPANFDLHHIQNTLARCASPELWRTTV